MKKLEKYIVENRSKLDTVEQPDADLIWKKIQARQKGKSGWQLHIGRYWKWAIAASIVLAAGLYFLYPDTQGLESENFNLAQYYPELAEQEGQYQQLVAEKEKEIGFDEIKKEDFEEVFIELQLLEDIRAEQLGDLPEFFKNDLLVKSLTKYYERKIRILERLTKEIEKKNYYEHRRNEKSI